MFCNQATEMSGCSEPTAQQLPHMHGRTSTNLTDTVPRPRATLVHSYTQRVKEAINIRLRPNNFNRENWTTG